MRNVRVKGLKLVFYDRCHGRSKNAEDVEEVPITPVAKEEDATQELIDPASEALIRQMSSNLSHSRRVLSGEFKPELDAPSIVVKEYVESTHTGRAQWLQYIMSKASVRMALTLCIVGLLTLLIQGYHLSTAPDIFSDEGVYLLVGINIAKGLGLVVDHSTFLWHPPGYMLIEALYIKLTGLTNADTLTAVLSVRSLNVFFSACTAVLLMLLGWRLHSYKAGLFTVALFIMDPYVQRINRRNMLETLAMLCVLLGLYIFFTHRQHLTKWQRFAAGSAFGLAVLTKEPMFLELLSLILYVLLFRRQQLRDVIWVAATAIGIYLLYPLGIIASGQWRSYLSYKFFGINRIIGLLTNHQSTSASITLVAATRTDLLSIILNKLVQYGMSYVLIALATFFTGLLILRHRQLVAARYLITWSLFSLGFGLTLGRVSDQYFYYLIVPSIVVSGYMLATLFETALLPSLKKASKKTSTLRKNSVRFSIPTAAYQVMWRSVFALFCVMFLYDSSVWAKTYALGSDDAYIHIIRYVKATIPEGAMIEVSDDVAVYYLYPSYVTLLDRNPTTIINRHVRYFIMSVKDAEGGFDAMTPQLYTWVIQNSHPLFVQNDLSFGKIGVYQLTTTATTQVGRPPGLAVKQ
jgi:Dolichyl-phosphate-mannose-protein mannosyltransferase